MKAEISVAIREMRTLRIRQMRCLPEVGQMVNKRVGIRVLDRLGEPLQGVRHAFDIGREARPRPITLYLSVKCSTLGLEGEEELGAR